MKKLILLLILIIIVAGLVFWFVNNNSNNTVNNANKTPTPSSSNAQINSFEECVNAGNPVQESYPRRCTTQEGKTLTEKVRVEGEDIVVNEPLSGSTINSPIEITGEAAGPWYFEGQFSAEVYDDNGLIGNGQILAEGDWMTEEMVPFTGEIEFDSPTSNTGEIILQKANPSGLPENEESVTVPVKF